MFPLLFVFFFLSSMNLPRDLIEQTGSARSPTWNPISYLVEGMRCLIITGWDGTALLALPGHVAMALSAVGVRCGASSGPAHEDGADMRRMLWRSPAPWRGAA